MNWPSVWLRTPPSCRGAGRPPFTDTLALWLAARYAAATRELATQDGPESWRQLRELCADVVELRRGDHNAERLRLERESWEAQQREAQGKKGAAATMAPLFGMLVANSIGDIYEKQIREGGRVPPEVLQFLANAAPEKARAPGVPQEYFKPPGSSSIRVNQGESNPVNAPNEFNDPQIRSSGVIPRPV